MFGAVLICNCRVLFSDVLNCDVIVWYRVVRFREVFVLDCMDRNGFE